MWKVSLCTFRKYYWFFALFYFFGDFRVWSRIILLNFSWVSIFSDTLIANISWMMAQTHTSHTIFLKSVMRTFRCIYEHFFNRISFIAKFSTKLQKNTFLDNFKTITQEENMEIRQKTSYYLHLLFLFCFYDSYLYSEIVKNHFNLVPSLVNFSL